jgi:hypothetical protein
MNMLDRLLAGERLWNPKAPLGARLAAMKKARDEIAKEHQAHLDDPEASHINTGVLLGALNLIDGLMKRPHDQGS